MSSYALFSQEASTESKGSLQTSATANGDGTPLNVDGYCTVLLDVSGSIGAGTQVNFDGRTEGGTWTELIGSEVGTGALATFTTTLGLWSLVVAGLFEIRARISNYGSGSVTVKGVATVLAGPAAGSEVTIAALPLPTNAAQETGGNLQTIAGAVSSSKMQVNLAEISGNAVNTGNGTATNCPRVSIASDNSSLSVTASLAAGSNVIGSLTANQSVNITQVNGSSVNTGNGTAANCPRVSIASDNSSIAVSATLAAGSNVIGSLAADQSVNLSQIAGNTVNTGNGTAANCPRVSIASDNTSFAVSATLATGSNVIGYLAPNQSVNLNQIAGNSVNTGNGTAANCPRVSIASDNSSFAVSATLATGSNVIGKLTDNQSVNLSQVAGNSISTGNGTAANCPRVAIASDNTSFAVSATLATGSNVIGKLTDNQSVNLSQVAGSTVNTGNGTASGSPRVVIANDNSAISVSDSNLAISQNASSTAVKGPMVQGVCTTSAPTYGAGTVVPLSFTTAGALRVDSGSSGGGAVTQSGVWQVKLLDSAGTNLAAISSAGAVKVEPVGSSKVTYIATTPRSVTPPANPYDFITLQGPSSGKARIQSVRMMATQNTLALDQFFFIKRIGTITGGTSTSVTPVPMDSTTGGASCTLKYYQTTNPTVTGTAYLLFNPIFQVTPGNTGTAELATYDIYRAGDTFTTVTLNPPSGGNNEYFCVSYNGAALPAGINVQLEIIWTEE